MRDNFRRSSAEDVADDVPVRVGLEIETCARTRPGRPPSAFVPRGVPSGTAYFKATFDTSVKCKKGGTGVEYVTRDDVPVVLHGREAEVPGGVSLDAVLEDLKRNLLPHIVPCSNESCGTHVHMSTPKYTVDEHPAGFVMLQQRWIERAQQEAVDLHGARAHTSYSEAMLRVGGLADMRKSTSLNLLPTFQYRGGFQLALLSDRIVLRGRVGRAVEAALEVLLGDIDPEYQKAAAPVNPDAPDEDGHYYIFSAEMDEPICAEMDEPILNQVETILLHHLAVTCGLLYEPLQYFPSVYRFVPRHDREYHVEFRAMGDALATYGATTFDAARFKRYVHFLSTFFQRTLAEDPATFPFSSPHVDLSRLQLAEASPSLLAVIANPRVKTLDLSYNHFQGPATRAIVSAVLDRASDIRLVYHGNSVQGVDDDLNKALRRGRLEPIVCGFE